MFAEYIISLLELTSLTVFAMMLHSLRRILGVIPLYLVMGSFFMLGQVALMPKITQVFQDPGRFGSLVYALALVPVLLMFLIIYESEGAQEAQRTVFGLLVLSLVSFYIIQLFVGQFNLSADIGTDALALSLSSGVKMQRLLLAMTFLHLTLFLFLPTFYQILRNRGVPIIFCLFLPICFFLAVSNQFLRLFDSDAFVGHSWRLWLGRMFAVLWVCLLANIYLTLGKMLRVERRLPFGFISSLFGHFRSTSQMRQSVLEWADRYQAVFENSGELIFLLDAQGVILNANTAAANTFGTLLNKPKFALADLITDAEGRPFLWPEAWRKLLSNDSGQRINTYPDMLLCLPDRKVMNVSFNLSHAVVNENDMALLIVHDTTAQRARELERQQLEEQLMHSQRMEAIGILAGGIAHDFNNLLHTVQANIEMLNRQTMPIPAKAMLGNIEEASKRASGLTSQLLGFARKGKFQAEILDLGDLIQQAEKFFQSGAKDIDIKIIIEPTPLLIKGDLTQLQQVILNLLINAKDALADKEGEKTIVIRVETVRADMPEWKTCPFRGNRATDFISITIRDNGCGMPPQVKEHIFEPFFTTKPPGHGTGMGLAMAYGCITNHRGWINVNSEPGQGSAFIIILPKAHDLPEL
ncbi:MAG: PAS domain-containing protein [Lentisphaerae bacterium]|nr:PAS domain-containing protein [Lentisphaerota bacterium]HQL88155.1 ATP-binding protein [Lentisphaeria bacterium]